MTVPEEFFNNYNIPYVRYGKHSRAGWVQVSCPFCSGNPGYHGGFNLTDNKFKGKYHCWRCGWHNRTKVIQKILGVAWSVANQLDEQYFGDADRLPEHKIEIDRPSEVVWPDGCSSMISAHKKYLKKRNFDPVKLEIEWGLLGTGFYGDYGYRIIIPIYHKGQLVSYQGRDITDKSELKYKACNADQEVYPHQNTLYGLDKITKRKCVVVEGVTDVWRLGPGAVGTFGIEFSVAQELLLARLFDEIFILYDPEEQAKEQAMMLGSLLEGKGRYAEVISLTNDKDPGDITDGEAKEIMQELIW